MKSTKMAKGGVVKGRKQEPMETKGQEKGEGKKQQAKEAKAGFFAKGGKVKC